MFFSGDIAQPHVGASKVEIPEMLKTGIWFGNLEGSLIEGGCKEELRRGVYNDVDAIVKLQTQIPFKAFGIANNHLLDAADVKTTIDNLRKMNVEVAGGGCDLKEAKEPVTLTDDDGKVYRILAFGWESIQCVPASNNHQGVNPYTRKNVINCVKKALKEHGQVVCFMHWDYELEHYPQPYDRQLAHELIDMGVAAVVGCHAHRVQPIEFYQGKPIVYGLGNFFFCQGHYMGGKLCFPKFCEEEYAFEMASDGYKLHHFNYDQKENRLRFVKSEVIGPDCEFDGKAEFSGLSSKEYEEWFKCHRVQKKLLPVFYSNESSIGYWMKSRWIKSRGGLINLLTKMNLKSADRANR